MSSPFVFTCCVCPLQIVVSLVNGRPGAMNFSYSPVLRDFTKATNIRLRFLRTNTLLGHLMGKALRDPTVTRRVRFKQSSKHSPRTINTKKHSPWTINTFFQKHGKKKQQICLSVFTKARSDKKKGIQMNLHKELKDTAFICQGNNMAKTNLAIILKH